AGRLVQRVLAQTWMVVPGVKWGTKMRFRTSTPTNSIALHQSDSLLAGFAIPTERALIMIGFASYCAFRGRQPHSFRAWILAFVVILILQPYAVFSISFWLSFVAVLALIYVLSHRVGAILGWAKWLWPQWAIFCLLAPMTIFTFGMISITSLQANLWAIPLISFCVVPFVFLGLGFLWIPALAHLCFEIGNAFVSLWWWGLKTSAKPEWAAFVIHAPSLWATVLAELGILWLIAPRAIPARYLGAVYCLPFMLQAAQIWGHP
ncbi:MAG: ComEC/Rec2 family competence protein, partial [Gammaproteobacteria bacterium]|nr:ComEC/Rec2 family competence protein [Gammaproteobacteria bacterium]